MPPKDKSKKDGKQLLALAQLNAVQTTYRAACRSQGVAVNKGLASQIEDAILEGSAIDKISFTGPDIGPGAVKATVEIMAAYPAVKNLACSACSIGNEGLEAIAALVRASGDKWWKGSRLRLLEVVADGAGRPIESWPATCMAHMSGGLAVQGQGHQQPNFLLDQTSPAVTPVTLQMQHVGLPAPSLLQLEEEWAAAAAISAPMTTTMYRALQQAQEQQQQQEQQRAAAGVLTAPPAAGYQTRPKATKPQGMQGSGEIVHDMSARMARLASLARGMQPAQEPADSPLAANGQQQTGDEALEGIDEEGLPPLVSSAPPKPNRPPSVAQSTMSSSLTAGKTSLQASSNLGTLAHSGVGDTGTLRARPLYGTAAAAASYLAGIDNSVTPLRPMTFSCEALQRFSLALGAKGHGLQVLVLDHNQLGDMGMHTLATGLRSCSALTHLSLSNCGLGAVAATALASVMVKDPDPLTASLQPKLLLLNLSRNPLGGQGLTHLCEGFKACTSLRVLNLSSCGFTEEDVPALGTFADALAANHSIDNIDLDANFFGDAGAVVFFPLVSRDPHIKKFRITARGMTRAGGGQLTALVRDHFAKKSKKRSVSPKKK